MIRLFLSFIAIVGLSACTDSKKSTVDDPVSVAVTETSSENNFGIVLHGGAGTILKEHTNDSIENLYKTKLEEAITAGHAILENGGTALDAVTKTINILEDSPLFNAGKGAGFTHEGSNELDASIMHGSDLDAGPVAGLTHIKNPIHTARAV